MFTKMSLARYTIVGAANLGVVKVISDVVTATTNRETAFASLKSKIGLVVIGSIVHDVVSTHVNSRIDQIVEAYLKQKAELDAKVEEKVQEAVAKKTEEPQS